MSWWIGTVMVGFTAFAATNIDDIIVLMIFFGQTNRAFRPWQIVIGQYLGVIALVIASLPGFFGGMIISKAWIGLLGLLPIAMGINSFLKKDQDGLAPPTSSPAPNKSATASILSVAAVTFANGGDNIGIYVPLFASSNWVQLGIIINTFLVGVALWCAIAFSITRQPTIAHLLNRYSAKIVPFVLIILGIYILIDNKTYSLLPRIF